MKKTVKDWLNDPIYHGIELPLNLAYYTGSSLELTKIEFEEFIQAQFIGWSLEKL